MGVPSVAVIRLWCQGIGTNTDYYRATAIVDELSDSMLISYLYPGPEAVNPKRRQR